MNPTPETPNDLTLEIADLKGELAALRRVVSMAIAIVLLLTLALNAVFLWQSRVVRRQLATARMELAQHQRTALPVMDEFLQRLQRFAATHPDFTPILAKYIPARTNRPTSIDPQPLPKR